MKTIAITGGSSLFELGSVTDVQLFFDCLDFYIVQQQSDKDWHLLTDCFYRRYIPQEELNKSIQQMHDVYNIFATIRKGSDDWNRCSDLKNVRTDFQDVTLANVFKEYFENFFHCAESAKINFEGFANRPDYKYEPVRLVIHTQPWLSLDLSRPLEEYDKLNSNPFWHIT